MNLKRANHRRSWAGLTLVLCCLAGAPAAALADPTDAAAPPRDGAHDFDFDFGVWHTHIHRILDPFAAQPQAVELDGMVTVSKIWGGKASLEQIEVDGPAGHLEAMNLFLYNPKARQWSETNVSAKVGVLGTSFVGEFRDGRAELISTDTLDDRAILVRAVWSNIEANSHDYTESFSNDGGATWKLSFTAHLTRPPVN